MEICTEIVTVTTVGEDASAAGVGKSKAMHGFLLDIKLDYAATAPATTDLTVTDVDGNVVYAKTDSVTDVLVAPRQKLVDNAAAAITNSFDKFALNGPMTFTLAGSNALAAALVAKIRYLRL
jgi:hypothetical protein